MRVDAAERALMELSEALTRKYRSDHLDTHVVMALGLRSRSIYGGFIELITGQWPISSFALLRQLVEVNILLRFLRESPELRSQLWVAEQFRHTRAFISDIARDPRLRSQWHADLPGDDKLEDWGSRIAEARDAALLAKLGGIRESGPLIPSVSEQVRLLDDPAATEAYVFAYRRFSGDVHVGMVSFDRLVVDETPGEGWMALSDEVGDEKVYATRVLGVTSFASTLMLLAQALELPWGDVADRVRASFMEPANRGLPAS